MGAIVFLAIVAFVAYKIYMKKNGHRIELEKAVKKGDREAMSELATNYSLGEDGCNQDIDKAVQLMMDSGITDDMILLAGALRGHGNGKVPTQPEKAFMLLDAASALGSLKARYMLGDMYCEGEGTVKNEQKALELYTSAVKDPEMKNQEIRGIVERDLCRLYALGFSEDGPGYKKGQNQNFNLAEHWGEASLKDFVELGEDNSATLTCDVMVQCYMLMQTPRQEQHYRRWAYWAAMKDMVNHVADNPGRLSEMEGFMKMNPDCPVEFVQAMQDEAAAWLERTTGVAVELR